MSDSSSLTILRNCSLIGESGFASRLSPFARNMGGVIAGAIPGNVMPEYQASPVLDMGHDRNGMCTHWYCSPLDLWMVSTRMESCASPAGTDSLSFIASHHRMNECRSPLLWAQYSVTLSWNATRYALSASREASGNTLYTIYSTRLIIVDGLCAFISPMRAARSPRPPIARSTASDASMPLLRWNSNRLSIIMISFADANLLLL